jgi:hypothetical protein
VATKPEIPVEEIEAFCRDVQEPLKVAVRRFCDEAYEDILFSLQDYLFTNALFNIGARFDTLRREVSTAYLALQAVESAATLQEAKANAYAHRKGYWSEERAAEYRAEAETAEVSS